MNGGPPEPWEQKLVDEELRRLSGHKTASVIVELELSRPQVELERSERGGIGGLRPRRVETGSEADERESRAAIAKAETFLADLVGRSPVWLGAARAFGVEASGDQLEAIARSPLVRRVYLSRVRR